MRNRSRSRKAPASTTFPGDQRRTTYGDHRRQYGSLDWNFSRAVSDLYYAGGAGHRGFEGAGLVFRKPLSSGAPPLLQRSRTAIARIKFENGDAGSRKGEVALKSVLQTLVEREGK